MRTTVTLDADVQQLVRDAVRERGLSFKTVVNEAIRSGFRRPEQTRRFVQKTYNLGAIRLFPWAKH